MGRIQQISFATFLSLGLFAAVASNANAAATSMDEGDGTTPKTVAVGGMVTTAFDFTPSKGVVVSYEITTAQAGVCAKHTNGALRYGGTTAGGGILPMGAGAATGSATAGCTTAP